MMSECLYPSPGTNRIPYDFDICWQVFLHGYLPYSSEPEPAPEVMEEKFHGLTKSQITDIQQAELGCKKVGNQTYCDISVREKIDYYLQQNHGEKENEN